jgi:hypothetical protein
MKKIGHIKYFNFKQYIKLKYRKDIFFKIILKLIKIIIQNLFQIDTLLFGGKLIEMERIKNIISIYVLMKIKFMKIAVLFLRFASIS